MLQPDVCELVADGFSKHAVLLLKAPRSAKTASKFQSSSAYSSLSRIADTIVIDNLRSETKIDRIERRLDGIEGTLRHLTTLISDTRTSPTAGPSPLNHELPRPPDQHGPSNSHRPARTAGIGNDGLVTESMAAKSFMEQTVGQDLVVQRDPQLLSSLESLRSIATQFNGHKSKSEVDSWATFAPDPSSLSGVSPGWEQIKPLLERTRRSSIFQFRHPNVLLR